LRKDGWTWTLHKHQREEEGKEKPSGKEWMNEGGWKEGGKEEGGKEENANKRASGEGGRGRIKMIQPRSLKGDAILEGC
jgi:hypothetical protein